MSQLTGDAKVDLKGNVTVAAALHISATQQPRRKVLLDLADTTSNNLPRLALELDEADYLSVVAEGRDGSSVRTKPISPLEFAFSPLVLRYTCKPGKDPETIELQLYLDGVLASEAGGECDMTCHPEKVAQSIGADSTGRYPGTFRTYALMCIDRSLDALETTQLETWMRSKFE